MSSMRCQRLICSGVRLATNRSHAALNWHLAAPRLSADPLHHVGIESGGLTCQSQAVDPFGPCLMWILPTDRPSWITQ